MCGLNSVSDVPTAVSAAGVLVCVMCLTVGLGLGVCMGDVQNSVMRCAYCGGEACVQWCFTKVCADS